MKIGSQRRLKGLKAVVLVSFMLQLTACGTVISLAQNDYRLYGGVRRDIAAIQDGGVWGVLAVVDLPLSLVLDSLALPLTLSRD